MPRLCSRDKWGEQLHTGLWLSRAGRADCTRTRELPRWNRNIVHENDMQEFNCKYSIWAHLVPGRGLAQEDGIPNGSQCPEGRALAVWWMSCSILYSKFLLPCTCEHVHCTIIVCVNRHIRLHIPKSQYVVNKNDKISYILTYRYLFVRCKGVRSEMTREKTTQILERSWQLLGYAGFLRAGVHNRMHDSSVK